MSAAARDQAARLIEAAAWRTRFDAGDADEGAFALWHADPGNADAWARVNGPIDLIAAHANDTRMMALRQEALHYARRSHARLNAPQSRWKERRWKGWAAAAAMVAAIGAGAGYWLLRPDDYATGFNERRVVMLADGSRVSLDSASEVTVHYTAAARELHLLRGQARFDVAHDVERPFSVAAGGEKVVATGTAFNIDMTQPKVVVTLIEGHVVVFGGAGPTQSQPTHAQYGTRRNAVELHAGEQLAALPDRAPVVAPADIRMVTAWTGGQLIFDDQPLSEVVARVNHYAVRPIVIADARTAALRLSGSFNTGDTDGFVDIVTHYLPVRETMADDGTITLRGKSAEK